MVNKTIVDVVHATAQVFRPARKKTANKNYTT